MITRRDAQEAWEVLVDKEVPAVAPAVAPALAMSNRLT